MTRISRPNLIAVSALTGVAAIGALSLAVPGTAQNNDATVYTANLQALPNTSGTGSATLRLSANGTNLLVHITASGLEAGGAHLGHIHGLAGGAESDCPTIAQDTDGDTFVELAEGLVTYGPIIIDFMNIDPNQDGTIDFRTTVKLEGDNAGALPLANRHIVVHGMSTAAGVGAGTPGEVNGSAGFKTLLPVLCGEIVEQQRGRDPLEAIEAPNGD